MESYGIDSIYDPSDTARLFYEIQQKRIAMEEARRKKREGITKVGTSAWKMWSGEQRLKEAKLLKSPDYMPNPDLGWLSKQVTPGGGRVVPTETALARKDFVDIRGPKTLGESITRGAKPVTSKIKSSDIYKSVEEANIPSPEGATKTFGSTLGKVASGLGTAYSAYDLATNWKKKSSVDKGLGLATTTLGALSLVNPAFGVFALGSGLLDKIFD